MTYRVTLKPSARRELNRLPDKIRYAALAFIYGALAENPQRVGRPLRSELEGHRKAVRGSYRVIYRIVEDQVLVEVVHLGHRADVYRPQ